MIGIYAHHHGLGHVTRSVALAEAIEEPTALLTSSTELPDLPPNVVHVPLPPDDCPAVDRRGVTAGGSLHWAPLGAPIKHRSAAMARWLASGDASLLVSDVSVEAALLARLFGLPTVVVRQAGSRWDRPHRLAFDVASGILAPYPRLLDGDDTPHGIYRRTFYSGFITAAVAPMSRASARRRLGLDTERPTLVIALGGGGTTFPFRSLERLPDSLPGWSVILVGERGRSATDAAEPGAVRRVGWVTDVVPYLSAADVVATHGGTNLVAQTAMVGRPLIAVAEDRPFDEQRCRVEALQRQTLAVGLTAWPERHQWATITDRALEIGGGRLHGLVEPDALTRTARWLRSIASSGAPVAA